MNEYSHTVKCIPAAMTVMSCGERFAVAGAATDLVVMPLRSGGGAFADCNSLGRWRGLASCAMPAGKEHVTCCLGVMDAGSSSMIEMTVFTQGDAPQHINREYHKPLQQRVHGGKVDA